MTESEQDDGKNIQKRQLNQLVKMVHGVNQTLKEHGFDANSSEA